MNYLQTKLISNLTAFRDYLEEQDQDLLKRQRYCVHALGPQEPTEPQDFDKAKNDGQNSTHSSDDGKDGTSDTDVAKGSIIEKKIVKNNKILSDCQKIKYVSCDLADISVFYVESYATLAHEHALYQKANSYFAIDEKLKLILDKSILTYGYVQDLYSGLSSYRFSIGLFCISDRAFMLSAKVEDSIKQGQELAIYGYKQLDQDKDGKVSIDDLKICSSTAYSFVMNIDFKKAKLQFFEKAIGYMKQELTHDQDALKKANEQKELKVNSHFE